MYCTYVHATTRVSTSIHILCAKSACLVCVNCYINARFVISLFTQLCFIDFKWKVLVLYSLK